MAKINDAVRIARGILQDRDNDPEYRYSTEDLIDGLNGALAQVKMTRPDAFVQYYRGSDRFTFPEYEEADLDADPQIDFPLNIVFLQPVAIYMAGFACLRDDEYASDSRANAFFKKFEATIAIPEG